MDVGNPSNFVRMLELYNQSVDEMRKDLSAYSFSDAETRDVIARPHIWGHGYRFDPHGAVGYLGLREYRKQNPTCIGIVLETAHPAKFNDVVEAAVGLPVDIPERLAEYMNREKKAVRLSARFQEVKEFLMNS